MSSIIKRLKKELKERNDEREESSFERFVYPYLLNMGFPEKETIKLFGLD